jgi:hypothetical protein
MQEIRRYIVFLAKNKTTYLVFGKELAISEIAGLLVGVIVAEVSAYFLFDKKVDVSLYSAIADYAASIVCFIVIYYQDNKRYYREDKSERIIKVIKSAFRIWPSVIIADIAYIICRPYIHYLLMVSGLETGVAATIAHFVAFGIFNVIAIFSKSVVDYVRSMT